MSVKVGTDEETSGIMSAGLVESYLNFNGLHKYDGKFIEAGVFSGKDRWGEIVSLEVWPIASVGCSFIGFKAQLLPFETGVGVLGYDPRRDHSVKQDKKCKAEEPKTESKDEGKDKEKDKNKDKSAEKDQEKEKTK
ncbi:MAG: hypothetical protein NTX50_10385 [Candidatus Sumerlaeota bacterium]|nr:hypothetical protein [Candidatus Sumerlaeota bacterium]